MSRIPFVVLAIASVLGCKAETFGGDDPTIDPEALQVVAGAPLPGARITISAPWMAGRTDTMQLVVDGKLELFAVRDSSGPDRYHLDLPDTLPPGTHSLERQAPSGARASIGQVITGGFSALRTIEGSVVSPTQPAPSVPGLFVENAPLNGPCTLAVLDARNATLTKVTDIDDCGYGIGSTYLPGMVLAYRNTGWIRAGLSLGHPIVDSVSMYGTTWPGHELAPGLYLKDEKQTTWIQDDQTLPRHQIPSASATEEYLRPERVALSGDGAWAVSSHSISTSGLLIIDRAARTYHWSPGWRAYTRPLFQEDGRLVVYGWRLNAPGGTDQEIIAHVDPVTGAILDSAYVAEANSPYDLPVALSGTGWIVIPGFVGDHLELSIRDPNTLREIAHPRSFAFANSCYSNTSYSVVDDPAYHRFYIVGNDCPGSVPIVTFQLPE